MMEELHQSYIDQLTQIKKDIQESEILTRYLEEEDEEIFKELQLEHEPKINELHMSVAKSNPLQLEKFEEALLDDGFEGLYLPRILGYSVMRGQINDNYKYIRPQVHFENILLAICNSANFESILTRIGQSIQIGFALSSDIWITNLLAKLKNKRVVAFLESLRSPKFRDIRDRSTAYIKFKKQFANYNFLSADFPNNPSELKIFAKGLKNFFVFRSKSQDDNLSLYPHINNLVSNEAYYNQAEFDELVMVVLMYLNEDATVNQICKDRIQEFRHREGGQESFFRLMNDFQTDPSMIFSKEQDLNISKIIDLNNDDEISRYFNLMNEVHGKGYVHEEVIEKVKNYYDQHLGTSTQNKCVRNVIMKYFNDFISNLQETEYADFFEIYKTVVTYMNIFSNEQFNQDIKATSLNYIKKLIKFYPDKRGRDYQDVKKFVSTTFLDLGFLTEKQIVELFKTRRKKKPA